jgi:hypothetical protein
MPCNTVTVERDSTNNGGGGGGGGGEPPSDASTPTVDVVSASGGVETVSIGVRVTNTVTSGSGQPLTFDVKITVDGQRVDTVPVNDLPPGDSRTDTLTYDVTIPTESQQVEICAEVV